MHSPDQAVNPVAIATGLSCAYDPRMTGDPTQSRGPGGQSAAKFREKLGVYLFGVAIGFALLGFFMMKKQQAVQAQQAQQDPQSTQDNPGETTRDPAP